jgi:hypothetical protein
MIALSLNMTLQDFGHGTDGNLGAPGTTDRLNNCEKIEK